MRSNGSVSALLSLSLCHKTSPLSCSYVCRCCVGTLSRACLFVAFSCFSVYFAARRLHLSRPTLPLKFVRVSNSANRRICWQTLYLHVFRFCMYLYGALIACAENEKSGVLAESHGL